MIAAARIVKIIMLNFHYMYIMAIVHGVHYTTVTLPVFLSDSKCFTEKVCSKIIMG